MVKLLEFPLDLLVFDSPELPLVFLVLLLNVVSDRFLLLTALPLLLLVGKEHFAVSLSLTLPVDLSHLLESLDFLCDTRLIAADSLQIFNG